MNNGYIDFLIILGAGKIESERRARYAVQIAKQGNFHVLVTGKKSDKINPEKMIKTEAEYMAEVLEESGVCRERIHLDTIAQSTYENLALNRTLVEAVNAKTIGIVTGYFHSYRVNRLAKKIYPHLNIVTLPVKPVTMQDYQAEAVSFIWELLHTASRSSYTR